MMGVELRIVWDGTTPGLAEHRLSLAAWDAALRLLLQCVRRTASAIVRGAVGDVEYGKKGGRFANAASDIDLQLGQVTDAGCVQVRFACTSPVRSGEQLPLLDGLPERACVQVLEDLEAESRGVMRNALVRDFLRALPAGVTRQEYELSRDGMSLRVVNLDTLALPELPSALPRLLRLTGHVVAVGFPPGDSTVTLKPIESEEGGGRTAIVGLATPELVQRALDLRGVAVEAAVVVGAGSRGRPRFLWLKRADAPLLVPRPDVLVAEHFSQWDEALRVLAS